MPTKRRTRLTAAALLTLALANSAIGGFAGLALGADAPPEPSKDPFYKPTKGYAKARPGTILRSRKVSAASFGDQPVKAKAWQLLYRTRDTRGRPEATVATLLVPDTPSPAKHRPLVSYQEAEDSLGTQCAPSYQLRSGAPNTNSVERAEILIISGLLSRGYAVVVPDYEGPNPSYGGGVQSGRSTLDGIRAAQRFRRAKLRSKKTRIGMMGYSGGALATSWASELAPSYAPELPIKGVAEGGVPGKFAHAAKVLNKGAFAGYYLAVTVGLSRQYPRFHHWLHHHLTPEGKQAVKQVGTMCNSDIVTAFAGKDIPKYTTVPDPLKVPIVQRTLRAASLSHHKPKAPLFIYHAVNDELLPSADVDHLVKHYCGEGVRVKYTRDLASEHIVLVATGAPAAFAWLGDRLTGKPAAKGCSTTTQLSSVLSPEAAEALATFLPGLLDVFGP